MVTVKRLLSGKLNRPLSFSFCVNFHSITRAVIASLLKMRLFSLIEVGYCTKRYFMLFKRHTVWFEWVQKAGNCHLSHSRKMPLDRLLSVSLCVITRAVTVSLFRQRLFTLIKLLSAQVCFGQKKGLLYSRQQCFVQDLCQYGFLRNCQIAPVLLMVAFSCASPVHYKLSL